MEELQRPKAPLSPQALSNEETGQPVSILQPLEPWGKLHLLESSLEVRNGSIYQMIKVNICLKSVQTVSNGITWNLTLAAL